MPRALNAPLLPAGYLGRCAPRRRDQPAGGGAGVTITSAHEAKVFRARAAKNCPHESKLWPQYKYHPTVTCALEPREAFRVAELMANGVLSTGNPLKWIDYLRFGWFDPLPLKLGALTTRCRRTSGTRAARPAGEHRGGPEPLWNREVERARRAGVAPSLFRAAANYMAWHWVTGSFLRCTADMMDFVGRSSCSRSCW